MLRCSRFPLLIDGDIKVWESLSVLEYIAEQNPSARLWPEDRHARAVARSIASEMHSGFGGIREHLSMNIRVRASWRAYPDVVYKDIYRIQTLWADARKQFAVRSFASS
mgnify:CR=1 FL=1